MHVSLTSWQAKPTLYRFTGPFLSGQYELMGDSHREAVKILANRSGIRRDPAEEKQAREKAHAVTEETHPHVNAPTLSWVR
jgi:hypothetical protein